MDYEHSVAIDAPRERIWSVLTDVERWPEWTASMTRVRYISGDRIAVGSRAKIKQPRLPEVVWEVTEVVPGESFTWEARGPGAKTTAVHRLQPGGTGPVTVQLGIRQAGPLGSLVGLLARGLTQRYVQMEAEGLKARCGQASSV
jgi:uncharacterized protein YndB with AHSA1/START domain